MTRAGNPDRLAPAILVTGGTGFIGSSLVAYLKGLGYQVRTLSRSPSGPGQFGWSPDDGTIDRGALHAISGVVHLAGEGIASGRWTAARRQRILRSRVLGTRTLVEHLLKLPPPLPVLVSASGVNFYETGPGLKDEDSPSGSGFLAEVCRCWEQEALRASAAGIRTVLLRTGIVLHPEGGALAKMLPAFRLGLGGPIGSGQQGFPWIGLDDHLGIIEMALRDDRFEGPVNAVHPQHVTQAGFSKVLAGVLNRPSFFPLPAVMVKLLFGQMGRETLLADLNIVPRKLLSMDFPYRHDDLRKMLAKMLGKSPAN